MKKRALIAYFLESQLWKKHEEMVVNNYAFWQSEDPGRAARMLAACSKNKKGYTVAEYLYDMIDCVYKSNLRDRTKQRLYNEIDNLELYHQEMKTLESEL